MQSCDTAFSAKSRRYRPPIILQNPWWAKPFEIFARLLGTPGHNEADPQPDAGSVGAAAVWLHVR